MRGKDKRQAPAILIAVALLGSLLPVITASPTLAVSSNVVISEVYGGGGNSGATYTNDYIELFNRGTESVDVNGWSVQYASSGGTTWQVTPLSGTIAPGQAYLVQQAQGTGGTQPLPTPDASGSIAMSASSGKVALAATTATLSGSCPLGDSVDFVGYGSANCFEGSGATPTLSNTTAAVRIDGSCTDTDDNAADFTAQTAFRSGAPRNTASPLTDCDGGGEPGEITALLLLTELVVTPTGGEFIEIHNPGTDPVDLSDVYVTDATFAPAGTFYYNIVTGANAGGGAFEDFHARFPDGATIDGGEYQTIALAGSADYASAYGANPDYELFEDGAESDGVPDMREAFSGSINGQGGLTNSGEVAVLYQWDGASDLVTDLDYALWGDKDEGVDKTGVAADGPDGDTDATEYLPDTPIADQDVVSAGSHASGSSFQRVDPAEGTETTSGGNGFGGADETSENLSATWAIAPATPGVAVGEEPERECNLTPLTLISAVQGDGAVSPLAGNPPFVPGDPVTVQAVVTLVSSSLGGFFIQEEPEDVDGNPATSEGLFVAGSVPTDTAVGDTVEVTGGPVENFERTQINATVVVDCDEDPVQIDPTPLTLPADSAQRETLEGMVVETAQDLAVSALFTAYRFGELGVALDGPLTQPTSAFAPDDPRAQELADENADSLLFINDRDEFGNQNAPWFDSALRRAGDIVQAGTDGALNFSFGDFLLEPLDEFPEIVQVNERPAAPRLAGGNDIGAFNVLNYFNTFGNSEVLRGARNQAEFELQSAKIVEAILELDASILGLIELENDYEDHYDGDPETVPSVQTLVEQLNEASGEDRYDWIVPDEDDLTTEGLGGGGLGPDAIAQGIIYQPDRVAPVGGPATFDIDSQLTGEDTNKNRWPFAQSFDIDGQVVTVVVNHFKSKGSPCVDVGGPNFDVGEDVETFLTGHCNLTREYAAQRLIEWIETKPTGVTSPDTFVVGDLNSYEEEGPVELFIDAGYEDAVQTHGDDAFTFKFDGRYGRLDYVMVSPSAKRLLVDAAVWQANSPEPYGYLYFNDPVDTPETATAYASSDHDPVLVAISSPGRSGRQGR